MNILVIGGAGYIGSHVVREFLDSGHKVCVFDNFSSGLRQNLFTDAQFIYGDIMNYSALLDAIKGGTVYPREFTVAPPLFNAIVHLAAFKAAGESMTAPEKYSANNICGTINILNAAAACGIKNIIFSSSAAVYGEPQYLPIDENHPTNPTNYYGFTKLEIERILQWYDKLKGIHFAALRYFNAAGYDVKGRITGKEQNPSNLIPVIMETACGMRGEIQIFGNDYNTKDGTCIRDYVHVSDLAKAHVKALEYLALNNKSITVNLGSNVGLSVLDVIDAAARISGKPIKSVITERRAGDSETLYASSKLAQEQLGWKTHYSDIETLVKTIWSVYKT
ncbi:MAG: UDP-glucose 4-epimerase GalE [Termitinemataceae bacterium]|nr:MAG: UDP-glucose 4-epimerase GalE [Termitinemataceae bacterium]